MGKNMNFIPSLFLLNKHKQLWLWPSCNHPKTLSFRATTLDSLSKESLVEPEVELTPPDSCFTNSSESASVSTESEKYYDNNECSSVETIVRGARSERLFFQPDATSSILETQGSGRQCTAAGGGLPYKESVVMEMESDNPYGDFKKSMEEMVEIHDLKDWDCLEELLRWYLRMNGKNNHELIVGAFVDLLSGISGGGASSSDHSTASFTSAASTLSSPISSSPLSHQVDREKIIKEGKMFNNVNSSRGGQRVYVRSLKELEKSSLAYGSVAECFESSETYRSKEVGWSLFAYGSIAECFESSESSIEENSTIATIGDETNYGCMEAVQGLLTSNQKGSKTTLNNGIIKKLHGRKCVPQRSPLF